MKFITAIVLTALLSFIGGLYFPWWSLGITAFLIALLIHQRGWKAWFSGFLGIFVLWAGLAIWINIQNQGILASKIATILPLGGSALLLILVTAFIGGLVGGFGALSGSYLRSN
jgi:hypothetical protein